MFNDGYTRLTLYTSGFIKRLRRHLRGGYSKDHRTNEIEEDRTTMKTSRYKHIQGTRPVERVNRHQGDACTDLAYLVR